MAFCDNALDEAISTIKGNAAGATDNSGLSSSLGNTTMTIINTQLDALMRLGGEEGDGEGGEGQAGTATGQEPGAGVLDAGARMYSFVEADESSQAAQRTAPSLSTTLRPRARAPLASAALPLLRFRLLLLPLPLRLQGRPA